MPQAAPQPIEITGDLMAGRRGLVMGVANDRSLAWGIARAAAAQGAEIAFTYQDVEAISRRAIPLCESTGSPIVMPADVTRPDMMDALFDRIGSLWGRLDFVVHSLAFSDRNELAGRYIDTSRDNFRQTLEISAFSFTDLAQRAEPLMTANGNDGGALLTLTFDGSNRVFRSYNVMGVAKAALEASVRYLANDLGGAGIRGERALGRADAHAGRRRRRRCALSLPVGRAQRRPAPQPDAGRGRQHRPVPYFAAQQRGQRRSPLCRLRLQRRWHGGGGLGFPPRRRPRKFAPNVAGQFGLANSRLILN